MSDEKVPCGWRIDRKSGHRYFVPGCWGGVQNMDRSACYCDRRGRLSLEARMEQMEEKIERLSSALKDPRP